VFVVPRTLTNLRETPLRLSAARGNGIAVSVSIIVMLGLILVVVSLRDAGARSLRLWLFALPRLLQRTGVDQYRWLSRIGSGKEFERHLPGHEPLTDCLQQQLAIVSLLTGRRSDVSGLHETHRLLRPVEKRHPLYCGTTRVRNPAQASKMPDLIALALVVNDGSSESELHDIA
jgi:hypothetical protein